MVLRIRLKKSNKSCSHEKSAASPEAICSTRPARSAAVFRNCTTNALCAENGASDDPAFTIPGPLDPVPLAPWFGLFFLSIGQNVIATEAVEKRFPR
jgi:hypothetical protein